jgi:hypothetical protein
MTNISRGQAYPLQGGGGPPTVHTPWVQYTNGGGQGGGGIGGQLPQLLSANERRFCSAESAMTAANAVPQDETQRLDS